MIRSTRGHKTRRCDQPEEQQLQEAADEGEGEEEGEGEGEAAVEGEARKADNVHMLHFGGQQSSGSGCC